MENNKQTENQMNQLEQRVNELENNWKRAVADYRNLERRVKKERADFAKYANEVILLKLIPIVDDLERAVAASAIHRREGVDAGVDEGVKNILEKFKTVLESEGVTEIEALGKEFDPNLMEGVEEELEPGGEEKVVEVVEKGYMLGDKVLRPAKVKVK